MKVYCCDCIEYKRYNADYEDSISCSPEKMGKGDFYFPDSIIERDPQELNKNNDCKYYKKEY